MEFKEINDNYGIQYPEGDIIKTIKSKFNNQFISVINQSINKNTYAININDKCLYGYNDDYTLKPCANTQNYIHPQYFDARNINNTAMEIKYMNSSNKRSSNKNNPEPYTAFIHKSTQKCLSMDNSGVYLTDCDANNIYQRWQVSADENICLNN